MNPMMTSSAFLGKEKVRSGPSASLDNLDSIDGSKTPQEIAEYRDSNKRCRLCQHFDGIDSCSQVEGDIDPEGNSKYFLPRETGEETVRDSEESETLDV